MVVAVGRNHVRILRDLGVPEARIRMMRSFDPRSAAHALDVEDPYNGTLTDYEETFAVIEASLPGLHTWVDEQLRAREVAGRCLLDSRVAPLLPAVSAMSTSMLDP